MFFDAQSIWIKMQLGTAKAILMMAHHEHKDSVCQRTVALLVLKGTRVVLHVT